MLDYIRDIVIGIVVWAICEIIKVVFFQNQRLRKTTDQ